MASSEVSVRKLDPTARAIDLTQALVHMTSSSSSIIRGAWEIGQWLGREKINQYELEDCMQKAKGLVVPNQSGQSLFEDILHGVESKPSGPLFLQQSGSLGRLMAIDPNLSWIVSTIACLFQFHRSEQFISQTLTTFILRARQPSGTSEITKYSMYNPDQIRIKPVISKIVSSVWHNVVNAGCDTVPLPPELSSLCGKGHYLDPDDFSIVAHMLYFECKAKAVLRSDHLLRNVTLWLLLHYDGLLVFNVGGRIVYRKNFGNTSRELEVRVRSSCLDGDACYKNDAEKYEILKDVEGKFEEFLSGCSLKSTDVPPRSGIRQNLYQLPRIYPPESSLYDHGVQILIKCTAQSIMQWLLQIPLTQQAESSELGFSASASQVGSVGLDGPTHTIGSILSRLPAMINLHWGNSNWSQVIYTEANDQSRPNKSTRLGTPVTQGVFETDEIQATIVCFPILQDLLRKVRPIVDVIPVCPRIRTNTFHFMAAFAVLSLRRSWCYWDMASRMVSESTTSQPPIR